MQVVKSLRSFRYRKHEILVFHILDKDEETFPFTTPAVFRDLEDNTEITIEPRLIRDSYRKRFQDLLNSYHRSLLEVRIDHEIMYTNMPYDRALFRCLQKRGRLP